MKADPVRGLKFGAANAILFPIVMALNNLLKGESIEPQPLIVGAIFAFIMFSLIFTFTTKFGSDMGD
ncbi:hypothetical protein U4960_06660 [Altererythrobacter sp. H2]|uniref:hypothetical protein n=1 Tax=Altererythrobacter sp. H2 TaxID=3108391 RepID=UPI002B4BF881|nr:hypothetical protein [Altererythrobacter sp. H2]WRK96993.1 hypothetical protein U4960_06660 [Altererythrobacter sp. H2]